MQPRLRIAASTLALAAVVGLGPAESAGAKASGPPAASPPSKKTATAAGGIPLPRPRPSLVGRQVATATLDLPISEAPLEAAPGLLPAAPAQPARPVIPFAATATSATSQADLAAVKQVIDLVRHGKHADATALVSSMTDPLAAKLGEWIILRGEDNGASFERYMAFINANPSWPSVNFLRRRAETSLWEDKREPALIRAFFATEKPTTAKGRFALARALLAQGDRQAAEFYVREAWRNDVFSRDVETIATAAFGDMLTPADHRARMHRRLYAEDVETGLRVAQHLGATDVAIAKARAAVIRKAPDAKALLDAVPGEARGDPCYLFSRIQFLRRSDQVAEAAELMLRAPRDASQIHDTDQWWIERRLVARKLLDLGDAKTAYQIAADAAVPVKENYRAEHQFTAGWIALRFLNDPATALTHFARIARGSTNPIALARAGYWQGRAAEALGRRDEARGYYGQAAHYSTAYYGQLARARLGLPDLVLHTPAEPSAEKRAALERLEVVRAVEILYALGERDHVMPFMLDMADRSPDPSALGAVAELARRHDDARSMLLLGKAAVARGLPFDYYAFPTNGVPKYSQVGPEVEPSIVFSIARQESEFNPKTVSSANALGLLQVTPEAGRYVAKKFGATFDQGRLLSDSAYNVAMGAAELGDLIRDYRGSYILTFAGYNAGRGRIRDWVARYGDPRDPSVDPVDWVERIPFSETRNYVQRVLENVQVYRARFGGGTRLMIDADLHRGSIAQN